MGRPWVQVSTVCTGTERGLSELEGVNVPEGRQPFPCAPQAVPKQQPKYVCSGCRYFPSIPRGVSIRLEHVGCSTPRIRLLGKHTRFLRIVRD